MTISAHPPRSWPGDGRGIGGVVEDRERGANGVAGGLQGVSKIPGSSCPPVARQIEVMLERDIWGAARQGRRQLTR